MRQLVVLAVFMLSGCAGSSAGPSDASTLDTVDDLAEEASLIAVPGAIPFLFEETFSGTFTFQDGDQLFGEIHDETGGGIVHEHDLSAAMQEGTLFRLDVLAEAGTKGDIDVWVEGDGTTYQYACDCPLGKTNEIFVIGRAGSELAIYIRYDEHGEEPSFDYTIDATIQSMESALPPTVPMAMDLAAGEALSIRYNTMPVVVFDPMDHRVANLQPADEFVAATSGEHVVLGLSGGLPFQIHTNASSPDARILATQRETSDPESPVDGYEETFTVTSNTILVGFCMLIGEMATDPAVELIGPNETLARFEDSGVFVNGDWGECWETDVGDAAIVPGPHTLRTFRENGVGGEVFYWTSQFTR